MKTLLGLFVSLLLVVNCTNDTPLPNSYELLDRDNKVGLLPQITLRAERVAKYWQREPAGRNSMLLLGERENLSSFIIFDCQNLIKVDSAAQILSADLYLFADTLGETAPINVTMHQVLTSWGESSVIWDSVADYIDPSPIESFTVEPVNFDWNKIPLTNLEFLEQWINDSYRSELQIKGMLLKFETAPYVLQFLSSDVSSGPPYIRVVTRNEESAENDTTIAYWSRDASLIQYDSAIPPLETEFSPDRLQVGNGSGYRSLVQFDLSQIPRQASIHQALLSFHVNQAESSTEPYNSMSIAAQLVVGDSTWQDASSVKADSLNAATSDVASANNETFAFDSPRPINDVSRMVQRWVVDRYPNSGFIVYPSNANSDFQEMSFYSGVNDTTLAPTLSIYYSIPPEHRFSE